MQNFAQPIHKVRRPSCDRRRIQAYKQSFLESDFFVSTNDVLLNNLIVSTRVDSRTLNTTAIVAQSNVARMQRDPRINYSGNGINLELKLPDYGADAKDFYPSDKSAFDTGSDPK